MTSVQPDAKQGQGPPPPYPPPPNAAYPPPAQGYQPPPPGYQPQQPGYHPQQPGYQQHQQGYYGHPSTTVVVQQPGLGPQNGSICRYNAFPVLIVCQHCQATVTTSTSYSVGTYAWLVAGIILLFGCWLGCCLIPFCIDSCKDVIHNCPNCKATVGRYSRL